ncbi:MAG: S-layer homology domain-containing protein [Bacillota bacterium]
MRRKMKKVLALLICAMLACALALPVSAKSSQSLVNSRGFKDVPKGHWAYEEIMWMFEKKIIDGIGNNMFNPDGVVSRAEFAKMMVLTLGLEKYSPDTPSFLDVSKKSWEYPYVESAKTYLTGFRASNGDYYRPKMPAVREDMAVALVKALGYQGESYDESLLSKFTDAGQISPNLRKYVALAVKYGLMVGYDNKTFGPQGNLTRAQAALLLYRAFKSHEEKVTYDEEKVTYDELYVKPDVTVSYENGRTVVRWNKIDSPKLLGYAVVISKEDSTPQYPENGFLYYITDRNQTYAVVDNSTRYNGTNDFDDYLEENEKYYFSVTAIYTDNVVAGNAVRKDYRGPDRPDAHIAPVLTASIENGRLVLRWNKIESENLRGYIVVASKNDSTPSYPDNGYLYRITDKNKNYAVIDNSTAYNDGDFGKYFVNGEEYYFAVTAVYRDRNVTGNVIKQKYEGKDSEKLFPAPAVRAEYENGVLVVKWNKINSPNLLEYRVVISKNNESPAYPANGYYGVYDKNTTSAALSADVEYTNGDFSKLEDGTEYNISVTAVYSGNKYVAGNAVKKLFLLPVE